MSTTITVRDEIAYLDKIIQILPLLSIGRPIPHRPRVRLSSKIRSYAGRSCMPLVKYGSKTEGRQHFHANSQIFSENDLLFRAICTNVTFILLSIGL